MTPPGDAFAAMMDRIDPPMFVVTAAADGERSGCLVGFVTQTSIDPARFLVCVSKANHTLEVAERADTLAVHLLPADGADLAELFGSETGDEVDKFARCEWRPGPGGAPVVAGMQAWFAGRVLERLDLGDHVGFLLEPGEGEAGEAQRPLSFQQVRHLEPGHEA